MSLDFTLNGTLASDKGFTTHNVDKDILAQMDRVFTEFNNYPGATEISRKFPKRIVGCDGRLVGSSYSNLITSIIPAFSVYLYTSGDVRLKFSDESDRFFNAQFYRFRKVQKFSRYRLMDLEFICAWPFAEDVTADDNTVSSPSNGQTWTETNSGHYYAYPTITITFNQTQSHIYISNTSISGNRIDISKSFVDTDVLVLNSRTLNITLNDAYSPAGLGDGGTGKCEFPILDYEDTNTFQVGTDDDTLDVDVNINFRKQYLS